MPDVRPFRGVRYDVAQVGALADVVAPPYDVIDPALQERLYQASPYNVIRLELNRAEPGDSDADNRYTRAAGFLRTWLRQGVLRTDDHPSLYLYEQTFEVEGQTHTRKGFLARVRLEPFGQGKIFPHEQTLAGPKADRLALYQATGFNLSPIFGLYPDAGNEVLRSLEAGLRDRAPLEATDHLGVINRLWVVTDPGTQTAVQGLMGRGRSSSPTGITATRRACDTGISWRRPGARRPRRSRELLPDDAGEDERSRPPDPADAPPGLGVPRPDRGGTYSCALHPSSRSSRVGRW